MILTTWVIGWYVGQVIWWSCRAPSRRRRPVDVRVVLADGREVPVEVVYAGPSPTHPGGRRWVIVDPPTGAVGLKVGMLPAGCEVVMGL
ncbi:hypothetical protein [Intrasporangium mesophilum]